MSDTNKIKDTRIYLKADLHKKIKQMAEDDMNRPVTNMIEVVVKAGIEAIEQQKAA